MADEEIHDGEITELEVNQEEAEGFDSYGTDEKPEGKEPEEKEEKEESEGEEKPEGEKEEGEEKEKPEGEEETAEQRALKRAKLHEEEEKPEPKEEEKQSKESGKESKPASITKEQVKSYLDVVSDDDLPGEILIGDNAVDIKGFQKEYPDDFNAIKVLSAVMADKMFNQRIEEGGYIKKADIAAEIEPIRADLMKFSFWDEVRDAHPDAKKIAKSTEFNEWLEAQPASIRSLAGRFDAEDAISVMDFYLESKGKKKVEEHDKGKREAKQKKDGLLGQGMRNKPSTQKNSAQNDMEDEEAGFNEGLAQLGK